MRIITWNCARGPHEKKVSLLRALGFDIAVIQECSKPDSVSDQRLWFGTNPRQGIAVLAGGEYRLSVLPQLEVPDYVIPIQVEGPQSFVLFAVWAKANRGYPYVEGVVRAIDIYRGQIAASPSVLLGDLNSNAIWDHEHRADRSHTALVKRLDELGLASAYHQFFEEEHGCESRATIYFQWRRNAPYHIDYCFIPKSWLSRLGNVSVGSYEDWQSASDHRPLIIDLV
jgi:exonuclease III